MKSSGNKLPSIDQQSRTSIEKQLLYATPSFRAEVQATDKKNKIIKYVVYIILVLLALITAIILVYLYWYKPNYNTQSKDNNSKG